MKLTIFVLVLSMFLVGCNKPTPKLETAVVTSEPARFVPSKPYVAPPDVTRGYFKHFGFSGSLFRDMKPGQIMGLEGGLLALYTQDGEMWAIHTEPNDSRAPLKQRKIYLARISGEITAKRCGIWLREFQEVPAMCIAAERVESWETARTFMLLSLPQKVGQEAVPAIEKFLNDRAIKN